MRSVLNKNKKGALELSIGTIVVIVIAMSMLILGLVLVRTIFTGAQYNVDQLNKNVEAEINKLFNERGERTIIYLPDNEAEVDKGDSFGIAFGVTNDVQGESTAGNFQYTIKASNIQKQCRLTEQQADGYLILGDKGSFSLLPGADPVYRLVKFQAPDTAPLCEVWYDIEVTKDGQPYDTTFFIVKIT
tara:strand:+ start:3342 stop:3905 length:564 start_codon:yes stop_codon:yes gene_type:complete